MSHFLPIELKHASRLLNHGPTVLITSYDPENGHRNVMAAAWSMPVEFEPPRVAIVVDKSTWTRELIEKTGSFGICIPTVSMVNLTYAVGSVSGRDEDKFNRFSIIANQGPSLGLPVIESGCAAWMECRLLTESGAQQKYDTFFGEVISAAADQRVFINGHWNLNENNTDLHTLHHLGGGNFLTDGRQIKTQFV
ncbi:flavin reductase family protein [Budviciaceae bacterium BWR-B9]|uniref:Flavin reductase family protein n=1 Tax=Limnobaculum allomyrinae TaxID=2791986 RepID=A0ABS1ILU3_9GAMM|nr:MULTISPECIES: flavin reductase family protein [Limnobaculum]MBK5142315.1 flavin reductase family protein [Limnobaculum allomyrinae]MBV7690800.1 flavin reductase family protein [Limnobaculum sp. M2-1]